VTTEVVLPRKEIDDKRSELFWALFGYITGKNDKGQFLKLNILNVTRYAVNDPTKLKGTIV
jgi:hypothetical protein